MPYYFALGSFDKINARVPLDRVRLVKFFHPNLATKELRSSVNTPILRYSDMLLTYAEALNEQLGPNSEAIAALNQVRRRARGEGTVNEQSESIYPDLSLALSKEQFRQAILIERAREFIAEGERRNELNRHDLLASTIKEHRNITIKPGYVLYPIPEVQRSLNSLLSQNPDY